MYRIILFLSIICSSLVAQSQSATPNAEHGLVKWLTFEEAFELNKKQPKPFIVDVYTDWCGWCKHMIKTTYSNPDIANYINTYFYPVQFDAESKDTIEYLGTKYINQSPEKKRSVHQLAYKLLGQNQSYPSTVFLGNNLQFTLLTSGYLDVKKIEPLLVYMVENIFRMTSYNDFETYYKMTYPENPADTLARGNVNRYSLAEALELSKKQPKKILLDIYTNWCNGCRVMNATTFSDSLVAGYLNEKFYLVPFNAETKEAITFNGTTFQGAGKSGQFHELVAGLTKGNFALPTVVMLDEKLNVIDVLPFYMTPGILNPVIHFYGTDSYKSVKWADFQKEFQKNPKTGL